MWFEIVHGGGDLIFILNSYQNELYGAKEANKNDTSEMDVCTEESSTTWVQHLLAEQSISMLDILFYCFKRNKYAFIWKNIAYQWKAEREKEEKTRCKILHMLQLLSRIDIWFYVWCWLYFYHFKMYFCLSIFRAFFSLFSRSPSFSTLDIATS